MSHKCSHGHWLKDGPCWECDAERIAHLEREKNAILKQVALSLDWGNVPPLDVMVKDIRARRDGAQVAQERAERLEMDLAGALGRERLSEGAYQLQVAARLKAEAERDGLAKVHSKEVCPRCRRLLLERDLQGCVVDSTCLCGERDSLAARLRVAEEALAHVLPHLERDLGLFPYANECRSVLAALRSPVPPAPLCPTCQVVHDPGECRIEGG